MKTSELTGPALDWAVAKCEEEHDERITVIRREDYIGQPVHRETWKGSYTYEWWAPSRMWQQGGPIIERERVFVKPTINKGWRSYQRDPLGNGICHSQYGPTPLIAAMRCYVTSKLGDEVEIPEELQ